MSDQPSTISTDEERAEFPGPGIVCTKSNPFASVRTGRGLWISVAIAVGVLAAVVAVGALMVGNNDSEPTLEIDEVPVPPAAPVPLPPTPTPDNAPVVVPVAVPAPPPTSTPTASSPLCTTDSDCASGLSCGRQAFTDENTCCNDIYTDTTGVRFCKNIARGAVCDTGTGDFELLCAGDLQCGYLEFDVDFEQSDRVCCTFVFSGPEHRNFCGNKPAGSRCGFEDPETDLIQQFDDICTSGACFNYLCQSSQVALGSVCDSDGDCLAGRCGYDENNDRYCCANAFTDSVDNAYCPERPNGASCTIQDGDTINWVDDVCRSGRCNQGVCSDPPQSSPSPTPGEPTPSATLRVSVTFDDNPDETLWLIETETGLVAASGPDIPGLPRETLETDLMLPPDTYSFIMRDFAGDGLCCLYGNGSYQVSLLGNTASDEQLVFRSDGDFGSHEVTQFVVPGA